MLILYCFSFISSAQDTILLCGDLVSINVSRIDCNNPLGSIDITYINPGNTYSYEWYDTTGTNTFNTILSTNKDYIDTSCGVYTLIVYDNNVPCDTISKWIGCPLNFGFGYDPIPCKGGLGTLKRPVFGGTKFDPDSSLTLSDSLSGDEYYFYTWITADDSLGTNSIILPDTIENLIGIPSGWYKTIVEDAIGCTDTIEFREFKDPQKLLLYDSSLDSIMCNGDNTSIELQVKGGRKYSNGLGYLYYFIQDTDTIAFSDSSGQSINFYLGSSPLFWIPDTIFVTNLFASSDSLLIHIVDSSGCILDSTILITQPDSIIAQIYINSYPICSYDSTWIYLDFISGGFPPYSYHWSDGNSLDSIFVSRGFNKVFITDSIGCIDSTNGINVQTPPEIVVTDSVVHINCKGDSSGQIILHTSGGTGAITTDWGLGINHMALSAGNYTVLINDSLGCNYPDSTYLITENPPISINFSLNNPTCLNHANGNIKVNISGGVAPYLISWDNGSVLDSLFGLQVGLYIISVTDSLGCIVTDSVELQSTDSLNISFVNYTANLSCYGELTAITANISGGTTANGYYSIEWNNGATTNQTIIGGGIHQILVSDDVGCEDSLIVFISSPISLFVDTNKTNPSCTGNDGSIDIVVNGGTLPYEYQWSTGDTGSLISNRISGSYWVMVTDSCGIKDSLGIVLDPYISTLNIDNTNLTHPSCINNDGEIDVIVSGGFPPYTYLWSNGAVNNPFTGLGFGNYTVLVTDSCDLTTTATYILNQQQNTVSATGSYNYLSLWSFVSVNGSNPPFSIDWTSISMTADSIQGLCEGNYPITVTDSKNCVDTLSINVFYNINQLVDASTSTVIDTSWGLGPFTYLWSNGQTNSHTDSLCEGYHSVTVTADGGPSSCLYTEGFTIDPMQISLNIDEVIVNCESDFEGKIIADLYNNIHNLPYSFLWSTGDTTKKIEDGLSPGTYTINILYNNGCKIDTSIIIEEMLGPDCIPNVFTPNNEGGNNVWELENTFLYEWSTITIYGRFGKKVYESVGYDTPWDGKNKKGKDVPDGTYFYSIILKGGIDAIRGTVTVIR